MSKERKWQSVNADQVQEALESSDFIHQTTCGCGVPLHTFRIPGESLEGYLRPCGKWDRADRAKTAELHYYTATGQKAAVAVRLSTMLWQAITTDTPETGHLWGRWVRITYKGSQATRHGHAKKIYLIEVDKGTLTPKFEGVGTHERKQSKPRSRRPIRRPAAAAAAAAAS